VRRGLPFIGLVLASWFAWPIIPDKPQLGDHFLFWFAGHLVLTGASPYDLSSWQLMGTYGPTPEGAAINVLYGFSDSQLENLWPHPPWTALVMMPFGALPLTAGVLAWHAVLVIAGLAVLVAGAWSVGLRRGPALAVALAAVALSNPFVTALRTGHFDVLVVLGAVLLTIGLVRARPPLVVTGALLAVLKPHVILLVLPVAAWTLVRARAWGTIVATIAPLGAMAAVTLAFVPLYLPSLVARLDVRLSNGLATTWELGRQLAPSQPLALAVLLILMAFVSAVVVDRATPVERRTAVRMALAMALSLVIAPYANAYDGVLLAPLVFVAFGFLERRPIALAIAGMAVVVLSWWLSVGLVADWGSQSATAIVPIGTLVGTACIALFTRAVTPRSVRISEGDRAPRLA
jgi:Glycosyltransferase family 87